MNNYWKLDDASSQTGRVAIVTGANSGLGFETALALAGKGAKVILACRDPNKADAAKMAILAQHSPANIVCLPLDTSSFASVRLFAERFKAENAHCDLLINNAGIMMSPHQRSVDGFENQFATNYLGHFLLTGLLLPLIIKTPGARVVSLSSLAHHWSDIHFDDINFEKGYSRKDAYGQSKSACLMFAFELQRRLQAAGLDTLSLAAHPGFSSTNLAHSFPFPLNRLLPLLSSVLSQSAADGALPTLYAALGSDIRGGDYTGPAGKGEQKGPPTKVGCEKRASDPAACKRLWEISERMTGFTYTFG